MSSIMHNIEEDQTYSSVHHISSWEQHCKGNSDDLIGAPHRGRPIRSLHWCSTLGRTKHIFQLVHHIAEDISYVLVHHIEEDNTDVFISAPHFGGPIRCLPYRYIKEGQ